MSDTPFTDGIEKETMFITETLLNVPDHIEDRS